MSDARVLTVRPRPDECGWAFGGAPPKARIGPGAVLDRSEEGVAVLRRERLPDRRGRQGLRARPRRTAAAMSPL
ncbi:hypothetical protein [Streptomyces odontomachi]|uniref:hypothetical protein n=1 Tax=Streptomyces odontomachi TaxID=2944940 RepID=UPI0027E3096E|nr:hypothetical protein [Streptomyces sp. ODS25]